MSVTMFRERSNQEASRGNAHGRIEKTKGVYFSPK